MPTIGFIGSGRVTRIMLEGWARAGHPPGHVLVTDADAAAARALERDFPTAHATDMASVAASEIVVVSLHPPAMLDVLPAIRHRIQPRAIVLSLAPKLRFAKLSELLGGFGRLARQNPNAPSIVNRGYNPIAFAAGLDEGERSALLDLLRPLGECPVVDEITIEAYALISAMGPTYLWFQFDLLRRLATEFGLSDEAAREAVAHMVHGAAATLLESDLTTERVLDLVPVKPLAGDEATIVDFYRSRLEPLHAKLTS